MEKSRYLSAFLALTVVTLLAIGIIAVYSTTYAKADNSMLYKQIIWVAGGIVMALIVSCVPKYLLYRGSKWILVFIGLALGYLMIVNIGNALTVKFLKFSLASYMPLAQVRNGACRWLAVGPITIQPAEFAKFALILFLSCYYGMRDTAKVESWKDGLIIPGSVAFLFMALILGGRSLSNCVITCLLMFMVMYFAGVKLRMLAATVFILILAGVCVILLTPFRRQRIVNYIHHNESNEVVVIGEKKKVVDNYQLDRSICAIGSGGIAGLGIGHGRLKHRSIPESHTDFVFAVIGEELGFVGISSCILLYIFFMQLAFAIARQCSDRSSALMCMTVGAFLPLQAMMNMGVVCGLFPTTGVTAPLVSYGGSSIASIMLCVGLVFNAARQQNPDGQEEEESRGEYVIVPSGK